MARNWAGEKILEGKGKTVVAAKLAPFRLALFLMAVLVSEERSFLGCQAEEGVVGEEEVVGEEGVVGVVED